MTPQAGEVIEPDLRSGLTLPRTPSLDTCGEYISRLGRTATHSHSQTHKNDERSTTRPTTGGAGARRPGARASIGRVRYHGAVIRPPSEADSLIVQVTYGCSNNTCDFCGTYLEKPFAVRPFDEVVEDVTGLPASVRQRVRRVFLADGDAMALSTRKLDAILDLLHRALPDLERVSSYANARNLLGKSVEELAALRERGIELLYLGLESGDEQTLADIHKGITVAEQIEGCRRASDAGLQLSVTAILGLAGRERSLAHAEATGEGRSPTIDPEYIGSSPSCCTPGTAMERKVGDQPGRAAGLHRDAARAAGDRRPSRRHRLRSSAATTPRTTCPSAAACPATRRPSSRSLDRVLDAPAAAQLRPESWRLL